jgi:hypothetical protein
VASSALIHIHIYIFTHTHTHYRRRFRWRPQPSKCALYTFATSSAPRCETRFFFLWLLQFFFPNVLWTNFFSFMVHLRNLIGAKVRDLFFYIAASVFFFTICFIQLCFFLYCSLYTVFATFGETPCLYCCFSFFCLKCAWYPLFV